MTPEQERFDEIGDLLRSNKPDPQPPPELEARILLALRRSAPRVERRVWLRRWFVLPPALAMAASLATVALVLMRTGPQPDASVVAPISSTSKAADVLSPLPIVPPIAPDTASVWSAIVQENPLEMEVRALQRDANRATRFLIDCLPTLSNVGD